MNCLHCANPNPDSKSNFCCSGCEHAYNLINRYGLSEYYNLYTADATERKVDPDSKIEDLTEAVEPSTDANHFQANLIISGIKCAACIWVVESILQKQTGVKKARVNFAKKSLFLEWQGNREEINRYAQLINSIGYKLLPLGSKIINAEEKKYDNSILKALAVAGFGSGNVMLFSFALWFSGNEMGQGTRDLLHFFSLLIGLPIILYSSRPFLISALNSMRAGYPNMDLPISVAIVLATIFSVYSTLTHGRYIYFDSVTMLLFLLLIGRYLDMQARRKVFRLASELSSFSPDFARVEKDGKTKIIQASEVKEGMLLIVAVGEKIGADGVVVEGESESEIDSSLITGESLPKFIKIGSEIYAGSINLSAPFKFRVTKPPQNSMLAEIVKLVANIETSKNRYVRIADKLARIYTPAVHIIALLTFLFWCFTLKAGIEKSLLSAITVLIITCPCALALAAPIAQVMSVSSLLKKGILIKNGEALEKLNHIDTIIFDKTKTITKGELELMDILYHHREDAQHLWRPSPDFNYHLKLAASLAKNSGHPISAAIVRKFQATASADFIPLAVAEHKAQGLQSEYEGETLRLGRKEFCQIKVDDCFYPQSSCFMRYKNEQLLFLFNDQLKSDALEVITELNQHKSLILLSGDTESAVAAVAKETGIKEFYAEQTPISKAEFIQKLKEQNKKIMMIGDGINDAPALALADVSVSFALGTSLTQNVAEIIINNDRLAPILDLLRISSKSILVMKQNFALALVYNLCALSFAVSGLVTPLIAAVAMSSSSLLVILNSLRINR